MKKAKDYYKADYAVLDTKKMINKGKLLLLSDVSITWVTFRGHWALSYMEVASCHPGVMVVMNKDNSKYFEKLKVTIQVKAQQFPLFPNKLLNCLIVSCCVLLALQVVLLATEMDAVKSENPSECVSEGDTLHSNARHKGMLILQFFFFFFNCSLTSTNMDNCLWATSGPSRPYLAWWRVLPHWPQGNRGFRELPVGCINT